MFIKYEFGRAFYSTFEGELKSIVQMMADDDFILLCLYVFFYKGKMGSGVKSSHFCFVS